MVASYLKRPVRIEWDGGLTDPLTGRLRNAQLGFEGMAVEWMDISRLSLTAKDARLLPGLPASLELEGLTAAVTVSQPALARRLARFRLPFRLRLEPDGIRVDTEIGGLPLTHWQAELEVIDGWFVLQPLSASALGVPAGVPAWFAPLLRTYLPLPPLGGGTRLHEIIHGDRELTIVFALEDVRETLTPGLLDRMRERLRP